MYVCVYFHIVRSFHFLSTQIPENSVTGPRAYKASFSIRRATAVNAADGWTLRWPKFCLITLLLPGMVLVVSCRPVKRGRNKDKIHTSQQGYGQAERRPWGTFHAKGKARP